MSTSAILNTNRKEVPAKPSESASWPVLLDPRRQALQREILDKFGVVFRHQPKHRVPRNYRDDVTAHGFFSLPCSAISDQMKAAVLKWLEECGWHWSIRRDPCESNPRRERIYIAPKIPGNIRLGYHATRMVSIGQILAEGLKPSIPERQTTSRRWDCEGNIYLCEALGYPADAGVAGSRSSHWWRDELSRNNRFADPDWVILEVRIGGVIGAELYRDMWSESGIIVRGVDVVPAELIRQVYPQ